MADPTSNTPELLKVEITSDVKDAMKETTRYQTHLVNNMKKVQKAVQKSEKGFDRLAKSEKLVTKRAKAIKELVDQMKALDKLIEKREKYHETLDREVESTPEGSDARKRAERRRKEQKELSSTAEAKKARKAAESQKERFESAQKYEEEDDDDDDDEPKAKRARREERDLAEERGEKLAEPLREIFQKDAPTLMKRANKILTTGLMHVRFKGLMEKGEGLSERGKAKRKQEGAGLMAKAGGGLQQVFGGLVKAIGNLGPVLSIASSFMMSFIKILLDAEAAAKLYNKQLLATTGTSTYLNNSFGDVTAATKAMGDSLDAARNGAVALSNIQWGISKETALAFQSAITAEGVSLDRLGKATADATVTQEQHTKTIQVGVGYSRAFGVSLSDIGQMQGQLMSDLGMGAASVQTSFQTIVNGAHEAGMESNKFFGIVRGFSSDLSLFTLRLEDVSKAASVLGKVMDPRKVGQFIQNLNQKFTGGLMENVKFTMMGDPKKQREIALKDMDSKMTNLRHGLAEDLGVGNEDIGDLMDLLKSPKQDPRKIMKWTVDHIDKKNKNSAPLLEMVDQLSNLQTRLASGNLIDLSSVKDALSPLAKKESVEDIIEARFHKQLDELHGEDLVALEALGISNVKELQELQRFDHGIMKGQEELIAKAAKKDPKDQIGQEQLRALKAVDEKTGKVLTGDDLTKYLTDLFHSKDQKGAAKAYWNSLSKTQQELLKDSAKEMTFQEKTAHFQTSALDKLDMLFDALMNFVYGVMVDIWEFLVRKFNVFGAGDFQVAKIAAAKTRDPDVYKAAQRSTDVESLGKNVVEDSAGKVQKRLQSAIADYDSLAAQLKAGKLEGDAKTAAEARMKALEPATKRRADAALSLDDFKKAMTKSIITSVDAEQADRGIGGYDVDKIVRMLDGFSEVLALPTSEPAATTAAAGPATKAAAGTPAAATPAGVAAATTKAAAGTPAAATPAGVAAATTKAAAQAPTSTHQEATTKSVDAQTRVMTSTGIKIDPATITGVLSDTMAKSVYEGAAKALFEYFMYSGSSRDMIAGKLAKGITREAIGAAATSGKVGGTFTSSPDAAISALQPPPPQTAMGGTVTSIRNGMAQIRRFPAGGEGYASVGRGETILPAGAGGRGGSGVRVQLELKGDLRRFVDARVVDGVAAHDRNRRHK